MLSLWLFTVAELAAGLRPVVSARGRAAAIRTEFFVAAVVNNRKVAGSLLIKVSRRVLLRRFTAAKGE